jgi:hypothetical protein
MRTRPTMRDPIVALVPRLDHRAHAEDAVTTCRQSRRSAQAARWVDDKSVAVRRDLARRCGKLPRR